MSSYVSASLRRLIADRAKGCCEYCLIHEDDTFFGCQVEHIIAEKHRGQTIESNLAFACVFCNRNKGSDIASLVPGTNRLCRLFNPRIDQWDEHFRLNGFLLEPLTDIGEVTEALLAFNHADRILEREILIETSRYPRRRD